MWPRVQRVIWLNRLSFLIVSHHFGTFSGHMPYGSCGIAAKIVYVTLQDHVIKGSGDFIKRNSALHIPTLPNLIAIDIVLMNINYFSFSHDITRPSQYMAMWLYGQNSVKISHHPVTFFSLPCDLTKTYDCMVIWFYG